MNHIPSALAALALLFCTAASAQTYKPASQRQNPPVQDTTDAEPMEYDFFDMEDESPIAAIDTINTRDKYTKIILFEDYTWCYLDMGRPVIDTVGIHENWDPETIHAFKDIKLSELPDEIDLLLADSLNSWCIPYNGKVISGYKYRKNRPHRGCDIPLSVGDTIRAAFDGVVRYSGGGKATGGYGSLVIIRHNNSLETYYGHLSKRIVEEEETVKAGEPIGLGGSTGRSTGPHLHIETRYKGQAFDPERIFDFEKGELRDSLFTLKKHYFNISSHYGQTDAQSKAATTRIVYKVKKGDTLGKIAKKYGTTVNTICKLNGISAKKPIRIGQSLVVRK